MKKLIKIFVAMMIIAQFSCSSTRTFELNINGKDVTFEEIQELCLDCQNLNSNYYDYIEDIESLRSKIKEINTSILANYGLNAPFEVINKYLSGPTAELYSKKNELDAFKDNKCFRFYSSVADDSRIYIFINSPNYLLSNEGEIFTSIDKLTIYLRDGVVLDFYPVSSPNIKSYSPYSNILHLYHQLNSNNHLKYFRYYRPLEVKIKYNNNNERQAIIY